MAKTVRTLTLHLALAALAATGMLAPLSLARAEFANPHGVAVIIGNKAYRNERVPEVAYAYRDAEAFRRFVLDVLGFDPGNVIDLRDATQAQMEDAFGNERSHEGRVWRYLHPRHGSEVVVFYSGHGVPGLDDGRGYLLPVDADPDSAKINGYPIDVLYSNLSRLEAAKSVRLFLDACFSGESDRGMLIRSASPVYVQASLPAVAADKLTVLTAASGKEVASWDEAAGHGLFTHYLLDALYGAGDADGDGQVTAAEAKTYLDDTMTIAARRAYGRHQNANLDGLADAILASAEVGGVFPPRPGLGDSGADDRGAVTEGKRGTHGGAVDEPPAPPTLVATPKSEEKSLGLTHAQRVLVQRGLASLGHDVGVVDGVFGRRTRAGLSAWQRQKGLAETGYLTDELRDALIARAEAQARERQRAEEAKRREEVARQAEAKRREQAEKKRAEAEREAARRAEESRRERERLAAARRVDEERRKAKAEAERREKSHFVIRKRSTNFGSIGNKYRVYVDGKLKMTVSNRHKKRVKLELEPGCHKLKLDLTIVGFRGRPYEKSFSIDPGKTGSFSFDGVYQPEDFRRHDRDFSNVSLSC